MYEMLKGMRVVEGASFVAAPLCGQTFVQLGADVIRFDPIEGGPDFRRWPLASNGTSYYWEGLNKGKRSVALDLTRPQGRELAVALATANRSDDGFFVTNYPAGSFLSHDRLAESRPDLITVRVTGSSDGRNAVDYTINCATGYPFMTGAPTEGGPINHVLPAWDVAAGLTAAVALLAADRERARTGRGGEILVPLSNVAFATLATLGHVAEVQTGGTDRDRYGNALYGTFGRDFLTGDGKRMMIVAVTNRQWAALVTALELGNEIRALELSKRIDLAGDEGARFQHRDELFSLVAGQMASQTFNELKAKFDRYGVGWGVYQTVSEALSNDPRLSTQNPLFEMQTHQSGTPYLTPGCPAEWRHQRRVPVRPAPRLGQHTDEVLADIVGLSAAEIGMLHDAGIVAGPREADYA